MACEAPDRREPYESSAICLRLVQHFFPSPWGPAFSAIGSRVLVHLNSYLSILCDFCSP